MRNVKFVLSKSTQKMFIFLPLNKGNKVKKNKIESILPCLQLFELIHILFLSLTVADMFLYFTYIYRWGVRAAHTNALKTERHR